MISYGFNTKILYIQNILKLTYSKIKINKEINDWYWYLLLIFLKTTKYDVQGILGTIKIIVQ